MSQVVRFELDEGGTVLVEPINEDGIVRASNNAGATLRNASSSFETAFCGVRTAAAATLRQFTSLPHQPDEVTTEFGVRLDLAVGAVIARTAVEGQTPAGDTAMEANRPSGTSMGVRAAGRTKTGR